MTLKERRDAAPHSSRSVNRPPTEINRIGFLPLLRDQKLLQNQKQKLLPDTEAPVHAEAPVKTGAPVVPESHNSYIGLQLRVLMQFIILFRSQ